MELLISEYPSLSLGCYNEINLNTITANTLDIVKSEIMTYGLPYDFNNYDTKRLFIHNFIITICNTKKCNMSDRFVYTFTANEFLPEVAEIVNELRRVMFLNVKNKPTNFYTKFVAYLKRYQLTSLLNVYFKQATHKLAIVK